MNSEGNSQKTRRMASWTPLEGDEAEVQNLKDGDAQEREDDARIGGIHDCFQRLLAPQIKPVEPEHIFGTMLIETLSGISGGGQHAVEIK